MFDLLGFWAAVTLLIAPTFLFLYWLVELFINREVRIVTDYMHKFTPFADWWNKNIWRPAYREDVEILVVLFGMLAIAISASVLACCAFNEDDIAFLEYFAKVCVKVTPVTSWVGLIMLFVITQRCVVRPALKRLYAVKVKIDKLG